MNENNSAFMPECWGRSKVLEKLLRAGATENSEVVHALKGRKRDTTGKWIPLSEVEAEVLFWSRVSIVPNECWIWRMRKMWNGYGVAGCNGRFQVASRLAWEFARGDIPDGQFVLHECDNPPCCRPDHLFLGDHDDNMADKVAKGRQAKQCGELNPQSILTAEQVIAIRSEVVSKSNTQTMIAARLGISKMTVSAIILRKSWKHI